MSDPKQDSIQVPLSQTLTPREKARLEALFRVVEAAYVEKSISRADKPGSVSFNIELVRDKSELTHRAWAVIMGHEP